MQNEDVNQAQWFLCFLLKKKTWINFTISCGDLLIQSTDIGLINKYCGKKTMTNGKQLGSQ